MPASPPWCPSLPREPAGAPRSLLVVGALADVVEDQLRRLFAELGIGRCASCRPAAPPTCPPVGPNTSFLLAQPFLAETARALEERGAVRLAAPFPLGAEGTTLWLEAAADAWRRRPGPLPQRDRPRPRARRAARLARAPARRSPASASSSSPTRQLEMPAGPLPGARAGMELVEVGTPYLHRQHLAAGAGAAAARHGAERGPGRRPAARPLPRRPARPRRSAASASPTRWRPRASPPNGRSSSSSRRSRATSRPATSPSCSPGRSSAAPGWWPEPCSSPSGPTKARRMSARCAIATAMEGLHYVLHAPQGDTYADLLFTMIERRAKRPPVTYTTFQARDLGGDTAELFKTAAPRRLRALPAAGDARRRLLHRRADPGRSRRPRQGAGPADPGRAAGAARPTRRRRTGARPRPSTSWSAPWPDPAPAAGTKRAAREPARGPAATSSAPPPSASATATTSPRSPACSAGSGIDVNVVAPMGATPGRSRPARRGRFQRRALPRDRRHGGALAASAPSASHWPRPCRSASAPRATSSPRSPRSPAIDAAPVLAAEPSRLPWYSRSVDSTYLTGKRVFIFGDATHAIAAARVAAAGAGLHGGRPRHLQPRDSPARSARPPSATASRR